MAKKSGGNPRSIPEGKQQVNFNLSRDLYQKVRGIAYRENVNNSQVIVKAIETYVEGYEKANGKIKQPKSSGL